MAVVEDEPGVTRDRLFGNFTYDGQPYTLIDTGGLFPHTSLPLIEEAKRQTIKAVGEADAIILLMDGRTGPHPLDQEIIHVARPFLKPVFYTINKIEGSSLIQSFYEFYQLGIARVFPVSAENGTGIDDLMEAINLVFPEEKEIVPSSPPEPFAKIAIVGRPNVGKSTFINALLGEERLITSPIPGTTRDAIDTLARFEDREYLFIDTAGIRRRGKIEKGVERASVIRSEKSIHKADIVFIMIDSGEGITDQDIKLVGKVIEAGKGFAILLNKWDLKKELARARERFEGDLFNYFAFIKEFPFIFLSSTEGFDHKIIYQTVDRIVESFEKRVSTPDLNTFLEKILKRFPPPLHRNKPVKIAYATQGGIKPPTFIFFTNFKEGLTRTYLKFLENSLRETFGFKGTPIQLFVKQKKNIYKKP